MFVLWITILSVNHLKSIEAVEMSHETFRKTASTCPQDCICPEGGSPEDSGNSLGSPLVNCIGLNLTQPPIPIEDSTASDLRLSHNKIAQIDLVFLKHFPNLKVLILNNNGLRYVLVLEWPSISSIIDLVPTLYKYTRVCLFAFAI